MLTGKEKLSEIPLDELIQYVERKQEKTRWSIYTEDQPGHADLGAVQIRRASDHMPADSPQLFFNPKDPDRISICHRSGPWMKCPIEVFEEFVEKVRASRR